MKETSDTMRDVLRWIERHHWTEFDNREDEITNLDRDMPCYIDVEDAVANMQRILEDHTPNEYD